ncbi:MAG: hypothetical protein RIT27_1428 [Pseudomonadota bacterium]|jgi:hypothetical protein
MWSALLQIVGFATGSFYKKYSLFKELFVGVIFAEGMRKYFILMGDSNHAQRIS